MLGHSHAECAYNDSLITGMKNFAKSAESYFYTYYKLLPLLEQNHLIDTIFIEFTNNQVEANKNKWIWGDKYMAHFYPDYAPFISSGANSLLFRNNLKGFLNSQSALLKLNLSTIMLHDYDFSKKIGGYVYLVRDQTDSILAASAKNQDQLVPASTGISTTNLEYLRRIISYCRQHGKKVYLVRSPIHPRSPELGNETSFQELRNRMFSDVAFLDFKNFPLLTTDYGNLEHLNYRGARKFSIFFDQLLKAGLLNKSDPQLFIDERLKI